MGINTLDFKYKPVPQKGIKWLKIKLLSCISDSLSAYATKMVYNSFILPTMLYCSMPLFKISDAMSKNFESVQSIAQNIIYGIQEQGRGKIFRSTIKEDQN